MNCCICNKELIKNQKITCSIKCRGVHIASINRGKPSPFKGKTDRWNEQEREAIGAANRGKSQSEEFKLKCSKRMKGKASFFKGKKHSEETLNQMSQSRSGSNSFNWKGGISKRSDYSVKLRRAKFGFTPEIFDERLEQQDNKCGICFEELTCPAADHCHKSSKPRGILCKRCNLLLGHAKDNIHTLINAIFYLKKWEN